jgi:hypothetical protein
MSESDLYAQILAAHSRGPTRLLRVNAGMSYQGRVIERTPNRLILSPWYAMKLAPEGWSDLIGWTTRDDLIYNDTSSGAPSRWEETVAQFVAIEAKVKGRTTPEQQAFIDLVRRSGGRAGIARSVEDAGVIIDGE